MDSRPTRTSMGRPDGAVKDICRSPFRLLNRRSGPQPGREIGTQHPDAETAEDLQPVTRVRRPSDQPDRLGQRIARGAVTETSHQPVGYGHTLLAPRWTRAGAVYYRSSSIMVRGRPICLVICGRIPCRGAWI